jgi:hypothetical protein
MTSIPVPAPEAPPEEPSGTRIGPVVIAFALGTAVGLSSCTLWRCFRWGERRRRTRERQNNGHTNRKRQDLP